MSKPYDWRDEEVDTYTKGRIDEVRTDEDEAQPEPPGWVLKQELEAYPDSIDYKCGICGRAKPCRQHKHLT